MDLSGIIFVVLAIGWAGYLIPKALKRQDDMALSRSVDSFSGSVRVLGRGAATRAAEAEAPAPIVHTVTRESARRAARRRRRVLGVLLFALVAVSAVSHLAYTPWWAAAIPAGLVLVFLLVARLTVRKQQVRRPSPAVADSPAAGTVPLTEAEMQPDLAREDTMGLSRAALAEAVAAPTTDAGALWDPLPMTLPTYVNKARARRTVRTIELTQPDVTSSGHDQADTALAEKAAAEAARSAASAKPEDLDERKVAGA